MRRLATIIGFLLVSMLSCAQKVEVVKFDFIDSLLKDKSDTTYLINFWATWCKPCVHELPVFEEVNASTSNKKIKVILVSLDFKSQLDPRLVPFVKQKNLKSKVVLLNEPDYNSWIDKVDASWGGGIPATLIINGALKRHDFYEKELTSDELNKLLNL